MRSSLLLSCALCAIVLAACSSFTPGGIAAASRLDPVRTDPNDIAVAIGVPGHVTLGTGDVALSLGFIPEDVTQADPMLVRIPLVVLPQQGPAPHDPSDQVFVLGFSPEGAARMSAAQRKISAYEAAGIDGEGSLGVQVTGGCAKGALDEGMEISTWLRTASQGDFTRLTRRMNLKNAMPAADWAMLSTVLKSC